MLLLLVDVAPVDEARWASVVDQIRRIADLAREARETELLDDASAELFSAAGRSGLFALRSRPDAAGLGPGTWTIGTLIHLGRASGTYGPLFALAAHKLAVWEAIRAFGTSDHADWLTGLSDGSLIGAFAASEPGAGSDVGSMATWAEEVDGGWSLSGQKCYVTNAPVADLMLVLARTSDGPSLGSLSAFVVPRGWPGVVVTGPTPKMGLDAALMGYIDLAACELPAHHLLGRPGGGMAVFSRAMLWERSCILTPAIGVMQAWLAKTSHHLRGRHQFGQPLSEFASNRARLVQMQCEVTTSLLLAKEAANRLDARTLRLADASLIKLQLSESFVRFARLVAQCYGGLGYMKEHHVEELVRDSFGTLSASGTSDIHMEIVADAMIM